MELKPLFPEALLETPAADVLNQLLPHINRKYFDGAVCASIEWSIPRYTVIHRNNAAFDTPLSEAMQQAFDYGKRLLNEGRWRLAAEKLKAPADAGHPDAELLLSHILRRTQGDWEHYAKRYTERHQTLRRVPPSCYYHERPCIALHPFLAHRKAPRFVMQFLIFHECRNHLFHSTQQKIRLSSCLGDEQAPHLEKTLRWLQSEGFPILHFNLGEQAVISGAS